MSWVAGMVDRLYEEVDVAVRSWKMQVMARLVWAAR